MFSFCEDTKLSTIECVAIYLSKVEKLPVFKLLRNNILHTGFNRLHIVSSISLNINTTKKELEIQFIKIYFYINENEYTYLVVGGFEVNVKNVSQNESFSGIDISLANNKRESLSTKSL